MRSAAPTLFAEGKHSSRSERYSHIPTYEVIKALAKEGFQPYEVRVGGSGDEDKRAHTKHLVRFRREGTQLVGGAYFETILRNAHDGTSAPMRSSPGSSRWSARMAWSWPTARWPSCGSRTRATSSHRVIEGTYTDPRYVRPKQSSTSARWRRSSSRGPSSSPSPKRGHAALGADQETGTSTVPVRPRAGDHAAPARGRLALALGHVQPGPRGTSSTAATPMSGSMPRDVGATQQRVP
jgi:hypothetical protein